VEAKPHPVHPVETIDEQEEYQESEYVDVRHQYILDTHQFSFDLRGSVSN